MNNTELFSFARSLVDIQSVTNSERQACDFLAAHLAALAGRFSGHFERVSSAPGRDNLFLTFDSPVVTLSTHIDTVPPFFASREDSNTIWGRGSCDAKGIVAAMIAAAESLIVAGTRNLALLFVVGEEHSHIPRSKPDR